jgi:hypothetical protein
MRRKGYHGAAPAIRRCSNHDAAKATKRCGYELIFVSFVVFVVFVVVGNGTIPEHDSWRKRSH